MKGHGLWGAFSQSNGERSGFVGRAWESGRRKVMVYGELWDYPWTKERLFRRCISGLLCKSHGLWGGRLGSLNSRSSWSDRKGHGLWGASS